jgi:hypothetical protein
MPARSTTQEERKREAPTITKLLRYPLHLLWRSIRTLQQNLDHFLKEIITMFSRPVICFWQYGVIQLVRQLFTNPIDIRTIVGATALETHSSQPLGEGVVQGAYVSRRRDGAAPGAILIGGDFGEGCEKGGEVWAATARRLGGV